MTAQTPARRKRGSGVPELYDFRQPMTLTREHARALEVGLQGFARQWGTLLTSRLGVLTTVGLERLDILTYGDHIDSLPGSTTAVVLQMDPSRTAALLQLPTGATMTLVDCMLGGPAMDLDLPFRELTEIEWKLMSDMLEYACNDLAYGLATVGQVSFSVKSVRYNPGFMQLVPASEQVVVARFELTLGPVTAPITLMLMAEPMLALLRTSDAQDGRTPEEQREHDAAVHQLADRMGEVPLPVAVRFTGREMTAAAVAALEVGSIVPLGHAADRPLEVVVGDVILAHAAIGANGTRAACLVVATEEEA
ncbi:flagellar motor switch protein FliM [Demequina iriomotensis]|uniref:flagellar motor switch protein FliM n=1 Tax=Demequina iriomotensis TaxID=1536641 RepID=UPI0007862DCE|nr:flagellar motor switch protein FliM [Demequina iriomotensis]